MKRLPAPVSRFGWHQYYARRFDRAQHPHAAQLALWYLFLHLASEQE